MSDYHKKLNIGKLVKAEFMTELLNWIAVNGPIVCL